jgi:hypothetical protein
MEQPRTGNAWSDSPGVSTTSIAVLKDGSGAVRTAGAAVLLVLAGVKAEIILSRYRASASPRHGCAASALRSFC